MNKVQLTLVSIALIFLIGCREKKDFNGEILSRRDCEPTNECWGCSSSCYLKNSSSDKIITFVVRMTRKFSIISEEKKIETRKVKLYPGEEKFIGHKVDYMDSNTKRGTNCIDSKLFKCESTYEIVGQVVSK